MFEIACKHGLHQLMKEPYTPLHKCKYCKKYFKEIYIEKNILDD